MIEIENLGSFQKDMQHAYEKMHRKELLKIIRPGVNILMKAVKGRTPERTGFLRRSIKLKPMRGTNDFPYAAYFVDFANVKIKETGKKMKAFYGLFVHNGTIITKGKRKHRKPRLFSNLEELAYQRDRAAAGYRIKPNPWVYEAFEATAQQAADRILEDIKNKL